MTEPFGGTATFAYNAAGQLASITDVIGLTSPMAYGPEDFVTAVTTPYGRTSFRKESADTYVNRLIEATDQLGGTERLEYRWATTALTPTVAAGEVPSGFETSNAFLDDYNTFYWDKLAWSRAAGDPAAATVTKWLVAADWPGATAFGAGVPHSVKRPLEGRVWYAYAPSRGPAVYFRLTYFQRDPRQPQIFSSANLGPKWRSDWLRAVEEVDRYLRDQPTAGRHRPARDGTGGPYEAECRGCLPDPLARSRAAGARTDEPDAV